ncbi:hypothetical protein ACO0K7_09180 [Undibacterium sp. Ji67W]|uniref:hypothetical protein n=1 Tax=Undibacterium sp. Ji67W TaxID=3413042 RepID=UPI003BF07276
MNEVAQKLAHASEQSNTNPTHGVPRPIWMLARDVAVKFGPPPFGVPSLDILLYGWKRHANIVLAGQPGAGASDLALTLAEKYATSVGPVIWIGVGDDLRSITQRLVLRDAGIAVPALAPSISLDGAEQQAVTVASGRIGALPIHYCDLDDACDEGAEQDFLVRVTSDVPTLIVVEPSVFDDETLDPFQLLVRRCNLFQLVESLKGSNTDWRVLWQVPMSVGADRTIDTHSLDDLDEPAVTTGADVVMFTYRLADGTAAADAEVIVVKNRFGSLATVQLRYDPALSSWSERVSA